MGEAVLGGLFLENLAAQDEYFELQMQLFEEGLINGCQIRVAHPTFTPHLTQAGIEQLATQLLKDFLIFVHLGGENVGVDLGQKLDEKNVFADRGGNRAWDDWNRETIKWGLQVAKTLQNCATLHWPLGVLHPGYGKAEDNKEARCLVLGTLRTLDDGRNIVLENVSPVVRKGDFPPGVSGHWSRKEYWGFGGTPEDMALLLQELGYNGYNGYKWRCLIDFTHLVVMVNQSRSFDNLLSPERELDKSIDAYMAVCHCPICHFSGIPGSNTIIDCHTDLNESPHPAIRDAMQEMEAICLEISFDPNKPDKTRRSIKTFRENYKIF